MNVCILKQDENSSYFILCSRKVNSILALCFCKWFNFFPPKIYLLVQVKVSSPVSSGPGPILCCRPWFFGCPVEGLLTWNSDSAAQKAQGVSISTAEAAYLLLNGAWHRYRSYLRDGTVKLARLTKWEATRDFEALARPNWNMDIFNMILFRWITDPTVGVPGGYRKIRN